MDHKNDKHEFRVPLNSAKSGHLAFISDAARVTIITDPALQELARGCFDQNLPRVRVEADAIIIQGRDTSFLNASAHSPIQSGAIMLNPTIPWEIEFRGRVSNLQADLGGLELRSLDLLGGAVQVRLRLNRPVGTSFIYIRGGLDDSAIRVPRGVGIRVQISGRVSHLVFDHQHHAAIGGETCLQNSDFKSAVSRYAICIADRVNHVTIQR